MNVLDLLRQVGIEPKLVSSTKGGEWHSACPACGGKDHRFCVWPEQNSGSGSWWCRICDKGGDNIEFLREFRGMDFREACELVGRDPDDAAVRSVAPRRKSSFEPRSWEIPSEKWRGESEELVKWAHGNLLKTSDQLEYLAERGIPQEAVVRFKLGWNPGEKGKDLYRARSAWGLPEEMNSKTGKPKRLWIPRGLVIPSFWEGVLQRVRFRRTPEAMAQWGADKKYIVLPGSAMGPMLTRETAQAWVVVEAELDAIAVDCAAGELEVGAVGLGSLSSKPDVRVWSRFKDAMWIGNALDFELFVPQSEEDERNLKMQTKAKQWWENTFSQCERWPVPEGKDPGDYVKDHGGDLHEWIRQGVPPRLLVGRSVPVSEARGEGKRSPQQQTVGREKGQLPRSLEEVRTILMTNRIDVHVGSSGMVIGCEGAADVAGKIVVLGQRPVVREWFSQIGEGVVNYRNFMKPMEGK